MTVGDIALRPPLTRDEASTLLDKTMGLVAATLGAFALGAYLGRDLGNASLRHAGRPGGLVDNRSQGVQLGTTQALARYWAIDYNWRACEARLNVLPQFTTQIDGVEIHIVHVSSPHPDALPLVMTHRWPGSVIELLDVAGPLTDPTAHGGLAEEAFDLMLPSLPGYGSSGEPTDAGWNPGRGGRGLGRADESPRLHPPRRPGWRRGGRGHRHDGSAGARAAGRHPHQPALGGAGTRRPAASGVRAGRRGTRRAHHVQGDRLRLSPGAGHAAANDRLRASGFTCRTGGVDARPRHGQPPQDLPCHSRRPAEGQSQPRPDRGQHHAVLVDEYRASAARTYWEGGRAQAGAVGQAPPDVSMPVGFTTFPGEVFRAPRSWVEVVYPELTYFNEVERGGHFAAWEEPELFSTEVRTAFKPVRSDGTKGSTP